MVRLPVTVVTITYFFPTEQWQSSPIPFLTGFLHKGGNLRYLIT
jgi:hypothetical protein